MSPQAKMNTKWILTVIGSVIAILVTVITATATITTKFNVNDADHLVIKSTLSVERERATHAIESIDRLEEKVDDIGGKQIQVMTNQGVILDSIEKIEDKM